VPLLLPLFMIHNGIKGKCVQVMKISLSSFSIYFKCPSGDAFVFAFDDDAERRESQSLIPRNLTMKQRSL
jgi:hypothetical protein